MANKKFLSLGVLPILSVFLLAGCNGSKGNSSNTGSSNTGSSNTGSSSGPVEKAKGAYNYLAKSYDERAEILGALESYAITNHLTGIPMFDDGGEGIYSSRLVFATENYVNGYGWGVLREGSINPNGVMLPDGTTLTDQDDPTGRYRNYLHYMQDENPVTINGADSQDTVGSNYDSYAHAGLFGTKLKTDTNGNYLEEYEWYPVLAKTFPEPVDGIIKGDDGEQTLASTYRFYVKTGADGVKYSTLSTDREISPFNGRDVAAEDYEFAMRMLLSGDINYYRASQYIDTTPLVGAANYFNVSQQYGWYSKEADAAWEGVGYHVGHDKKGDYVEVTYQVPTNKFYAMYQITSFTTPVPQEFFETVCHFNINAPETANYLAYGNVDGNRTPVDTYLSIGPYTIETWQTGNRVFTFKQNPDWWEVKEGAYQIEGIKYKTDSNIKQNPNAVITAFFAGETDSASVTSDLYDKCHSAQYEELVKQTPGSTTFKWNVNSCDDAMWDQLFGPNGTIVQTPESGKWDLKPAMQNDDFLNGLFVATDRDAIADRTHSNAAYEYFTDEYLIDPENGGIYNETQAHKDAVAAYYPDTNGYNRAAAETLFTRAIHTFIETGAYQADSTIRISAIQMLQSEINTWGSLWESSVESIFNSAADAAGYPDMTLDIDQDAVANQMDVYDKHLNVGQFDLCMGAISGSTLDPLGFMECLKSDNSSGFTLNWGTDTSLVDDSLVYDGVAWSYDALWSAANEGALVSNGQMAEPYLYLPDTAKRTVINIDGEDHAALQLSFSVNADLCAAAGIDLTVDPETGVPAGIVGVSVTASYYDADSTLMVDGQLYSSFKFSSSADLITYDEATKTLTVCIALDLATDPTTVTTDADEQEAYLEKFIDVFSGDEGSNPVSFSVSFSSNMKINRVPSTGDSVTIFSSAIANA